MKVPDDVDEAFVKKFLRRLTRVGPLGADLLNELDRTSTATRRFAGRLAKVCGYPNVGRTVEGW